MNGNIVIVFLLMKYAKLAQRLLTLQGRAHVRTQNARIEELRRKPNKTLAEQKEFTRLKYPPRVKSSLPWWRKLLSMIIHLGIFLGLLKLINATGLRTDFWVMVLVGIGIGIIINKILARYGLENQDTLTNIYKKR